MVQKFFHNINGPKQSSIPKELTMKALVLAMLLLPTLAFSFDVTLLNPCTGEKVLSSHNEDEGVNLWRYSTAIFDEADVTYVENSQWKYFESILGAQPKTVTVNGQDQYYGWCFSVNGKLTDVGAGDVTLNSDDQVVWYYGVSYPKNGVWGCYQTSACE